jgi:hypothetical protein
MLPNDIQFWRIIDTLSLPKLSQQGPTLPELVARRRDETLREKLARRRRIEQKQAAESAQLPLL